MLKLILTEFSNLKVYAFVLVSDVADRLGPSSLHECVHYTSDDDFILYTGFSRIVRISSLSFVEIWSLKTLVHLFLATGY